MHYAFRMNNCAAKRYTYCLMAEAYAKIEQMPKYNFATFISGPSKTADIEQTLVKGAHGAMEALVILI